MRDEQVMPRRQSAQGLLKLGSIAVLAALLGGGVTWAAPGGSIFTADDPPKHVAPSAKPAAASRDPSGASTTHRVKLDRPLKVIAERSDGSRAVGMVGEYDELGFALADAGGAAQTAKWSEFPAKIVMETLERLMPKKPTAADWVMTGGILYHLPDGKILAGAAFSRALKLDPKAKDQIEQAKSDSVSGAADTPKGSETASRGAAGGPVEDTAGVNKNFWGKLSDAEQAEAVTELKSFAENTVEGKKGQLKLLETKYFLFYSDLKPQEAQNWAGLLDKMYLRLAELFAIEKGSNIWRGKGLVIVFSKEKDYMEFEATSHKTDAKGTAGMCHSFGNGLVHIAFFRQPQDLDFAHVLVHESVHGFIHRYHSPARVPSWANEGLAEEIAFELVPQPAKLSENRIAAATYIQRGFFKGDFFTTEHIRAEQYPIAKQLCTYMIRENKRGYVAFINGIKDGLSDEEALTQKYGASEERIRTYFPKSLGAK